VPEGAGGIERDEDGVAGLGGNTSGAVSTMVRMERRMDGALLTLGDQAGVP
jgi:hypothetical protein